MTRKNRPFSCYILLILIGIQALSGLSGGLTLIIDPSGEMIQMPASILHYGIFPDFLIPGVILFTLLGLFPVIAFIGLIRRKPSRLGVLNIYTDRFWGWSYALYTGIMMLIWIFVEIYIIDAVALLHLLYGLLGVAILIAVLIPGVMDHYERLEP